MVLSWSFECLVMSRFLRRLGRAFITVLRAVFLLMLLVIPVPVGELFHKLLEGSKKAEATKVVKKEKREPRLIASG